MRKLIFGALVAILAFAMIGCPDGNGGGNNTPAPWKITYDANGWTEGALPSATTVARGSEIGAAKIPVLNTLADVPPPDAQLFMGWATTGSSEATPDGTGGTAIDATFKPTADTVLYVLWEQLVEIGDPINITYNANGWEASTMPAATTGTSGTALTVAAFPTLTESKVQKFLGWTIGSPTGEAASTSYVPRTNIVLYVKWEEKPHYVATIDLNGATATGTPTLSVILEPGVDDFAFSALPVTTTLTNYGFDFDAWYVGKEKIEATIDKDDIDASFTIRANWKLTVDPEDFEEVLALENTSMAIYKFSLPPGKSMQDYRGLSATYKLEYPENAAGEGEEGAIQIRAFRIYGNYKATDFITKDGDFQMDAYIAKFDTYNAPYIANNVPDTGWSWNYAGTGWDEDDPDEWFTKTITPFNSYPSQNWPADDFTGPLILGIGISGTGGNHIVQHIKDIFLIPFDEDDDPVYSTTSGFDKPAFASYSPIPKESSPYRGAEVPAIVKFDLNGQSGDVFPPIVFVAMGTAIGAQLPDEDAVDAPGYLFEGWFEDKACTTEVDADYVFNANATVYAKLSEDPDYVPPDPEAAHPFPAATGDTTINLPVGTDPGVNWINGTSGNQLGWEAEGEEAVAKFTWAKTLIIETSSLPQGLQLVWKGKKDDDTDFGGWNATAGEIFAWSATETAILDGNPAFPGVTCVASTTTTGNYIVTIDLPKTLKTYFKYIQCVDTVGLIAQKGSWATTVVSAKLIIPKYEPKEDEDD